jgi:membrane-associated PAP2 superfamily phosphatase
MRAKYVKVIDWAVPVGFLIGLTIPFWVTDLDVSTAGRFNQPPGGFARGGEQPWDALYHYGVIPAWILLTAAMVIFTASFLFQRFAVHRRASLFLILVMLVGPGLLVNTVFKEHWGRPRPRELAVFDGEKAFVPVWVKSAPENGHAFPSGHASTGFYLLAPFFLLRRRAKGWAVFFLALGIGYGAFIGLVRMIQGAHFLSDILWSLGFVYLSALALYYALRLNHPPRR